MEQPLTPPNPEPHSLKKLLGYALRCRCPNCGQARLYQAYLKPIEKCSVCGEFFGHIHADDGPAWLTILISGHIIVPLFVILQAKQPDPDWRIMIFCCVLLVILAMSLLPFTKAFFIAMIWWNQSKKPPKL